MIDCHCRVEPCNYISLLDSLVSRRCWVIPKEADNFRLVDLGEPQQHFRERRASTRAASGSGGPDRVGDTILKLLGVHANHLFRLIRTLNLKPKPSAITAKAS